MKKIILGLVILILFTIAGCNNIPKEISEIIIDADEFIEINQTKPMFISFDVEGAEAELIFSSSDETKLIVEADGYVTGISAGEATVRVSLKENEEIYSEITITVLPDLNQMKTRILAIDRNNNYIEFLNIKLTKVDENTRYLKYIDEQVLEGSIDDLYVGMENVYVEYDLSSDVIRTVLIDGETGFKNIRVGIRKSINDISDDSTRFHDSIDLHITKPVRIQTFDSSKYAVLPTGRNLNITVVNNKMIIKDGNNTIFDSEKRIIIMPEPNDEAITITSISRGSDEIYSGNIEISLYSGRMIVVNDINLEKYLYKVVPSEMPASYHGEALKAQAIAARTYAYKDILNRSFEAYGYTVDDSVQSQVYNNANAQTATSKAVDETKGLIMMHDGQLVNAFYYSTSAGITASAHEVWIGDDNLNPAVIPYLLGQNHTTNESGEILAFDYEDEENMLSFFKTRNVVTPDNTIGFHRWKTEFTKAGLTSTISKNLSLRYAQTPNLILTKEGDTFVSKNITTDIGLVENVYVGKRGTSGVVIELIVETTTNTYKIINQYNIRFTLRPQDAETSNYTANASSANYNKSSSNSILFSGFFAIETNGNTFTFYGGGNGHGVGMSQNGANSLGKNGKTFIEILNAYYSSIELTDISYDYQELENFRNYFSK